MQASDFLGMAKAAKEASKKIAKLNTAVKNKALLKMAEELEKSHDLLKRENAKDLSAAEKKGLSRAMLDRLTLSEKAIKGMARGLREVSALSAPVGALTGM